MDVNEFFERMYNYMKENMYDQCYQIFSNMLTSSTHISQKDFKDGLVKLGFSYDGIEIHEIENRYAIKMGGTTLIAFRTVENEFNDWKAKKLNEEISRNHQSEVEKIKNEILNEQSKVSLEDSKNVDTFSFRNEQEMKVISSVNDKLKALDDKMMNELRMNENFIISNCYFEIYNKHGRNTEAIENILNMFDIKKIGFISYTDFDNLLDEIDLIFNNEEKRLLVSNLVRNTNGDIQYSDFIKKIKIFDPNDVTNQISNFHFCYNDYIVLVRNKIKESRSEIASIWKNLYGNKTEINLNEFQIILENISIFTLNLDEIKYLFNKLSEGQGTIKFNDFKSVMKLDPPLLETFKSSNYFNLRSERNKLKTNSLRSLDTNSFGNENNVNIKVNNINDNSSNVNNNNNINSNFNNNLINNNLSNQSNQFNDQNRFVNNNDSNELHKFINNPTADSIRSPEFFKIIESKNNIDRLNIIRSRIKKIEDSVLNELYQNQLFNYFLISEHLHSFVKNTDKMNMFNYFYSRKPNSKDKMMSDIELLTCFSSLGIPNLNIEHIHFLVMRVRNKILNQYSYEEILNNLYGYNPEEKIRIIMKYHSSLNIFLQDMRNFFSSNLDAASIWNKTFVNQKNINQEQFIQFCKYCDYNLVDYEEYNYIFFKLSVDGGRTLNLMDLIDMLQDESQDANQLKNNSHLLVLWKKKIANYDENNCNIHNQKHQKIYNIIKIIHDKSISEGISDLTSLFDNVEVSNDGDCLLNEFKNKMLAIKLQVKDNSFIYLCKQFEINTNVIGTGSVTNNSMFNLLGFFDAYYSFYWKEKPDFTKVSKKTLVTKVDEINKVDEKLPYSKIKNGESPSFDKFSNEYIIEIINYTASIIIEEKNMNVNDFYKSLIKNNSNSFTDEEFKIIIEDELTLELDEYTPIFVRFLRVNYLDESKFDSVITLDRINQVYSKYSKIGVNYVPKKIEKLSSGEIKLGKEDSILKEFATHLKFNRFKWTDIFPYVNSNKVILNDFEKCFNKACFKITSENIEMLIKYLDPNNQGYIPMDVLKNNIKKHQNDYFDLPFQHISSTPDYSDKNEIKNDNNSNVNMGKLSSNQNKKRLTNFSSLLMDSNFTNIVNKVNQYIEKMNLRSEEMYEKYNKNRDNKLDLTEFIKMIKDVDSNIEINKISKVYDLIDNSNSGYIELNEFRTIFKSSDLSNNQIKSKIKLSYMQEKQIEKLFNELDLNKDGKISSEELLISMKFINPNSTMDDVNVIMKKTDKNKDMHIDKKEFYDLIGNSLKNNMLLEIEEKEYLFRLFQEEDTEKVGSLSIPQFKKFLNEKLILNYSNDDKELSKLINEIDLDYNGRIDIDELLNYIHQNKNKNLTESVINHVKSNKKIGISDFITLFKGLPMNFTPSFIVKEQSFCKNLPGEAFLPQTDFSNITFIDIKPSKNDKYSLEEIQTPICCKITFDDYASGVPIPDETILNRSKEISGRMIKICMFNKKLKKFIGNSISIECYWKKDYEDRWYFESDRKKFNHNFIVRYNNDSNREEISLVFEFVIYISKNGKSSVETSCGYCEIDLFNLKSDKSYNLKILGGTPFKQIKIDENDVRATRSGFAKIFSSSKVDSVLPIKVATFNELNKFDKEYINFLPANCILQKTAICLAATYRKYLGKLVLSNKDYNRKPITINNQIVKAFYNLVNSHEAMCLTTQLWNMLVVENFNDKDKNQIKNINEYLEKNLLEVVLRVNNVIMSEKYFFNELNPAEVYFSDDEKSKIRFSLINNAIRIQKDLFNKEVVDSLTPVEALTDFKPFSLNEFKSKKTNMYSQFTKNKEKKEYQLVYGNENELRSIITDSKYYS